MHLLRNPEAVRRFVANVVHDYERHSLLLEIDYAEQRGDFLGDSPNPLSWQFGNPDSRIRTLRIRRDTDIIAVS